ncbi:hypothetical protein ACJX0J_039317, partial [Zea mays]
MGGFGTDCTQQNEYIFIEFSWYEFSLLYNCALAANSYYFWSLRNLAYDQNLFVDNKYIAQMKKIKKTRVYGIAALDVKKLKDVIEAAKAQHTFLFLTSWFIWIIVMFTPFIFQHVYSILIFTLFFFFMAVADAAYGDIQAQASDLFLIYMAKHCLMM